jgi:hypothetical protein
LLLWTGIAHFVFLPHNRKYKNLIGPVSISAEMNSTSKTLIVNFMEQNNIRQELSDYVSPKHRFNKTHKAVLYYKSFGMKDLKDVQDAVSELEEGHGGIPILFKHYLKMGAKMLAFNVDPDFSDVLDCLMMTDLTQTDRHLLGKYMGKENLTIYLQSHNIKV